MSEASSPEAQARNRRGEDEGKSKGRRPPWKLRSLRKTKFSEWVRGISDSSLRGPTMGR